jgi:hypothetical protein
MPAWLIPWPLTALASRSRYKRQPDASDAPSQNSDQQLPADRTQAWR